MTDSVRKQGSWAGFLAVVLLVGIILLWGLMPPAVIESSWRAEEAQLTTLGWEATHRWVMHQMGPMQVNLTTGTQMLAEGLGNNPFEQWLTGRLYVTLLWGSLIIYRFQLLLMWGLFGIPLVLAAVVDGFAMREIRKHSFVSQSPIKHRVGVYGFRGAGVSVALWLLMPIPLPALLCPAAYVGLALSLWMWVGNLQKRL